MPQHDNAVVTDGFGRKHPVQATIETAEVNGETDWHGTVTSTDIFAIRQLVRFNGRVKIELNNGETGVVVFTDAIGNTASFEGIGDPPRAA